MTPNHISHPLWKYFVTWTTEKNIPLNKATELYWDCFLAGVRSVGSHAQAARVEVLDYVEKEGR